MGKNGAVPKRLAQKGLYAVKGLALYGLVAFMIFTCGNPLQNEAHKPLACICLSAGLRKPVC